MPFSSGTLTFELDNNTDKGKDMYVKIFGYYEKMITKILKVYCIF